MAKKNRRSLKNAFREGAQPSADAFADLIDSALNVVDDGFDKSDEEGFKVAQIGHDGCLMSFYENLSVRGASWSLRLAPGGGQLQACDEAGRVVLVLVAEPAGEGDATRVGINKTAPAHALDVDGVVGARGRSGTACPPVRADGKWHDITPPLDGCRAFEVMAGVGDKEAGRYALLHAFAVNTFNRKPHVTAHQSHYGARCDQLELRWTGETHAFTLQARTRCAYPEHVRIRCQLSELWFDPFMQSCDARKGVGGAD